MSTRERKPKGKGEDSVRIEETRGVFMISVAAELADMHPQTLRVYEVRGLIAPKRSPKGTRLYSRADVDRLRKIQRLTSEEGLNLAGVETVLELEDRVRRMRAEMARLRREATEMERRMEAEMERVRRSLRAEIVPYGAYGASEIVAGGGTDSVQIRVERPARGKHKS